MKYIQFAIVLGILFSSFKGNEIDLNKPASNAVNPEKINIEDPKADNIIRKAIEAHGGDLYTNASYSFMFREKQYSFTNSDNSYSYSLNYTNTSNQKIIDSLNNGKFTRYIDGKLVNLPPKMSSSYGESLNSVIYFATLPHKLTDSAVRKKYIKTDTINNVAYDLIEVTFDEEGGGKDYDDVFMYWVNKDTFKIDYLAYKYHVNGGGVRFRSFYNRRVIDGIIFQDYINWKAPKKHDLEKLSESYNENNLKEASRIEVTQIVNLK